MEIPYDEKSLIMKNPYNGKSLIMENPYKGKSCTHCASCSRRRLHDAVHYHMMLAVVVRFYCRRYLLVLFLHLYATSVLCVVFVEETGYQSKGGAVGGECSGWG